MRPRLRLDPASSPRLRLAPVSPAGSGSRVCPRLCPVLSISPPYTHQSGNPWCPGLVPPAGIDPRRSRGPAGSSVDFLAVFHPEVIVAAVLAFARGGTFEGLFCPEAADLVVGERAVAERERRAGIPGGLARLRGLARLGSRLVLFGQRCNLCLECLDSRLVAGRLRLRRLRRRACGRYCGRDGSPQRVNCAVPPAVGDRLALGRPC